MNNLQDISTLIPYEKNAKKHPKKQIDQVAASIKEFGFNQPIVVDKQNVVIVGHGRLEAAKLLGLKEVPVMQVDLTEEQANAYRLADNKLNESEWDMSLVIDELKDLNLKGFDIELTGFTLESLADGYDDFTAGSIRERFLVPPFSVLNTREGEWQSRKKEWLSLGIKSELGRADDLIDAGKMPEYGQDSWKDGAVIHSVAPATSIFDPVLCELMYLWFAPGKAKIIDPFAGGSVRGIVASKLGHQYMGTDLRAEQVEANRQQASKIVTDTPMPIWQADDALNIKKHFKNVEFDMQMTCPPYADLEVYSDDPKDLSTMEYDTFLEVYRQIIKESCDLLKENAFAVCVVGEVRAKDGTYKNFVQDTIQAYQQAGLHFYNEIILVNMIGTLGMRITRQFNAGRKVGKTHQNILVFWKGEPKNIGPTVKQWRIGEKLSTDGGLTE